MDVRLRVPAHTQAQCMCMCVPRGEINRPARAFLTCSQSGGRVFVCMRAHIMPTTVTQCVCICVCLQYVPEHICVCLFAYILCILCARLKTIIHSYR